MIASNSYAEFVLGVLRAQLVDCAREYPRLAKEFDRDFQRLSSAIDSHGIRFALDTMPTFRKHLDKCLAEGRLTSTRLTHFGVGKRGEQIPRLFRGLVLRVFDRSGLLKDQPDLRAVLWLRQLLGAVRKLEMDSRVVDRGNAIRDFYRVDGEVQLGSLDWDNHLEFMDHDKLAELSLRDRATSMQDPERDLFGGLLQLAPHIVQILHWCQLTADIMVSGLPEFRASEWRFRHGPGAVSDQKGGSYKYDFPSWPDRLDSVFPYADFAVANYAQVELEPYEEARDRGFFDEHPCQLHAVPKTLKTPRLIAAEPVCLQWCQQSIRDFLYTGVSRSLFRYFVDFRRQELNGDLALQASRDGSLSTIDLSSASDRISCWVVERIFRRSPTLLASFQATRSVEIRQEICRYSPKRYRLRKFSTMGNAVTFPVQSIVFSVLAIGCELYARGLRPSPRNIRRLGSKQVRVFGDDIIIPSHSSGYLMEVLETLGLRVNTSKSFTEGYFRESCGVDAYSGTDVTTVNITQLPRRTAPGSIAALVDVHNNLYERGYYATCEFMRKTARQLGFNKIREVKHGSGAFGWSTLSVPDLRGFKTRWNKDLMVQETLCLTPKVKATRVLPEGSSGLLQYFTEAAKVVTRSESGLGYLARRPKDRLTLRWAS